MTSRMMLPTIVFVLLGPCGLPGQETHKGTEYYPVQVGNTWHYREGDTAFLVRVAKQEQVDQTFCALLETCVNGSVVATEHVAPGKDGVYRYTVAGQKAKRPLCFLKLPPRHGETWTAETLVADQRILLEFVCGDEDIQVPAGKYRAIRVTTTRFEVGDRKHSLTTWYAQGVGMVKTTITVDGVERIVELVKFEPGK